jgi:uncharacterized protein (TIGR03083 family)
MDYAIAHRDGQERVVALVRSLDEARLHTIVPLNPAWRVRDVVAHMVGVCEDSLAGNFPDFSDPKGQPQQARDRDDWTQAQVERRRDRPFEDVLGEWDTLARRWEAVLGQDPADSGYDETVLSAAPLDVGCHLHDLRHALREPGDRDAPVTTMAFAITRGWLGLRLDRASLPGMLMRTTGRQWVIGHRPVGITVGGDRFDLFRSITGRRSQPQVLGLDWDRDPAAFLDALSPYPLPEERVIE